MDSPGSFEYILIRDASVLVRVRGSGTELDGDLEVEFFDVRTGVQLKEIYPELQRLELERGARLPREASSVILGSGGAGAEDAFADVPKVVNLHALKQRKLDSVVADSILDQVRVVKDLLEEILVAASAARGEERFWLSQQVLSLLRKFSGRELSELEETIRWFRQRPKK